MCTLRLWGWCSAWEAVTVPVLSTGSSFWMVVWKTCIGYCSVIHGDWMLLEMGIYHIQVYGTEQRHVSSVNVLMGRHATMTTGDQTKLTGRKWKLEEMQSMSDRIIWYRSKASFGISKHFFVSESFNYCCHTIDWNSFFFQVDFVQNWDKWWV